jgi:hypothetical protein
MGLKESEVSSPPMGWWMGKRDKQGTIMVDPKQWPALDTGDMSNIFVYVAWRFTRHSITGLRRTKG